MRHSHDCTDLVAGSARTLACAGRERFALTLDDQVEWFAALPAAEQRYVREWLAIFNRLAAAASISSEAARLSRETQYSAKRIADKWREFRRAGCRLSTIPRAYRGAAKGSLPPEFVTFWQSLVGQNRRSDGTKAAWRRLISEYWAAGATVPGYGTWQQWWLRAHPETPLPTRCPTAACDLPRGWSYDNLIRHLPKKAVVTAMRRGFKAAHDHQVWLQRDRSDLRPMEWVAIDDFWLDQMVYTTELGTADACRAVGILARDIGSGCILGWFLKPRTTDEFGKQAGIRQSEVKELLRLILLNHGLPPYPVTFLVENASASISSETQAMLTASLGDRIQIARTGVYNDLMLKHGFPEKGGKPWEKSPVESIIRLIHTHAGHLPGQTGPSYDRKPGDLDQTVAYCRKLLATPGLTEDDLRALRLPILPIDTVRRVYAAILTDIERRTDHRMQGFARVTEWRLHGEAEWRPQHELSQLSPTLAERVQLHTRLESSAERWQRMSPPAEHWSRVPAGALWFLHQEHENNRGNVARIRNGQVQIDRKALTHEPLRYWSETATELLRGLEGERVRVYYDPTSTAEVHLTTAETNAAERRYLATLPLNGNAIAKWGDQDALDRAAGIIHREHRRDLATVRAIQADQDERLCQDREVNEAIVHLAQERAATEAGRPPARKGKAITGEAHDDALAALAAPPHPALADDEPDPLDFL